MSVAAGVDPIGINRNRFGERGTLDANQISDLGVIPYTSVNVPRLKSRVRVPFPPSEFLDIPMR